MARWRLDRMLPDCYCRFSGLPRVLGVFVGIIERIPTFLTVGALVVIFVYLTRHTRGSTRQQLWAVGWTLVFTHFLAQLLVPSAPASSLLLAIDTGSLLASAIVFLTSVSAVVEDRRRRDILLSLIFPSGTYVVLSCYNVHARWPYFVCLGACFVVAAVLFLGSRLRPSLRHTLALLLCASLGAWAARATLRGSFDEAILAMLTAAFALAGIFCSRMRRISPATATLAGGFLCWGAVFPLGLLLDRVAPHLSVPEELWNIPKIFVALGMILAVVEEKSASLAALQGKAQRLNLELERFSAITSRLLSGAGVESLCDQIASALTGVTPFQIAAIQLQTADHSWRVAAASGLSADQLSRLQHQVQQWTTQEIHDVCARAQRVTQNVLLIRDPDAADGVNSDPAVHDHWLIPLCSANGAYLGCVTLANPRNAAAIEPNDFSRIESLAADMAVALELKSLQMQLVQSEKLAAVGQLVAGVAHELNNPLTAVMGFGELVTEEVGAGRAHDYLVKLVNETRRMKKIVDNLLRFSRQSRVNKSTTRLAEVAQDVLALREYHMRTRGVEVELDVAPTLSALAIDEDKVRQVLLNLINNSIDALETTTGLKQINLHARESGSRTLIVIEDSGPGFADLHRALDPFYTTKPVGRGTGLGLSICYGIVREHGGEVRLENVKPHGARVTVELPNTNAAARKPLLTVSVSSSAIAAGA